MTPDQQRWLGRAKELAADVRRSLEALKIDRDLSMALNTHLCNLPETQGPEGDLEMLDAFLKDMLPLADCCASLEARLPADGKASAQCRQPLLLAVEIATLSTQLLVLLEPHFWPGTTAPPPDLTKCLVLSASVPVRWWPKALRAAAGRELGQTTQQTGAAAPQSAPPRAEVLFYMAGQAASTTSTLLWLVRRAGPHVDALHAKLCTPATLASTLGNLAAVYAHFARFPATFKDHGEQWVKLSKLAAELLDNQRSTAVAAAVDANLDARQQLSAALLPYAAHLMKVADLKSASWIDAWGYLVPAVAMESVWPTPGAGAASGAVQRYVAMREGLLRLLRGLPPPGKPPKACSYAAGWPTIPLFTSRAADVAGAAIASAATISHRIPQEQAQLEAALRDMPQQGFRRMLVELPLTADLMAVTADRLAAVAAGGGSEAQFLSQSQPAHDAALKQMLQAALDMVQGSTVEELWLQVQPGELAAAGEAALRIAAQWAAQAVARVQPLNRSPGSWGGSVYAAGATLAQHVLQSLLAAAKQEVTAAPKPGGVRPSLHAQLRFAHTACKFVRAGLAPGTAVSGWNASAGKMRPLLLNLLEASNVLVYTHMNDAPEGRAPLTPEEKRALIGAALAQSAAGSAVVHLLPAGPPREAQQISMVTQLVRLLIEPDLADALLAQHADLGEQFVTGLAAVVKEAADPRAAEATLLDVYFEGVCAMIEGNRRLAPMVLAGAAGEALEAAVRQSLEGLVHEAVQAQDVWTQLVAALMKAAEGCFEGSGCEAAAQLLMLLQSPAGAPELPKEGWEALHAVRAAADEWLAQEAQQQWRQEQLLLCAEAAATRACSNLACTNLVGASEARLTSRLCSSCRSTRYCSTACQRADWGAGHMAVCKRLQARQAASG